MTRTLSTFLGGTAFGVAVAVLVERTAALTVVMGVAVAAWLLWREVLGTWVETGKWHWRDDAQGLGRNNVRPMRQGGTGRTQEQ